MHTKSYQNNKLDKPIIGITIDLHSNTNNFSYSDKLWYVLRKDYVDSITSLGGVPILLTYETKLINHLLGIVDGIMLTGNDFHIHPSLYKESFNNEEFETNIERSQYEMDITKAAILKNIPILGICNGIQIINIALGGTLIQNIKVEIPDCIDHMQPKPRDIPYHNISLKENTKLSSICKISNAKVNSSHIQSIKNLGNDLLVNALSADNIIEGVELPSKNFVLGVQWHPEYFTSPIDKQIIEAFINAARMYSKNVPSQNL